MTQQKEKTHFFYPQKKRPSAILLTKQKRKQKQNKNKTKTYIINKQHTLHSRPLAPVPSFSPQTPQIQQGVQHSNKSGCWRRAIESGLSWGSILRVRSRKSSSCCDKWSVFLSGGRPLVCGVGGGRGVKVLQKGKKV